MAKGFDRRTLLHGGCAWFAVGACTPKDDAATDSDSGGTTPTDTDDTPTTDTEDTPFADYPCDQVISPDGGWTELTLAQYPDLADPGGWYGVSAGGRDIVVAHVVDGCFAAVDRACAHEGVAINYVPERGQFVCPRHGAVYAADGAKVAGPQPTGVTRHPIGRVGDSVFVLV